MSIPGAAALAGIKAGDYSDAGRSWHGFPGGAIIAGLRTLKAAMMSAMNESEFNQLADLTLQAIEEAIEGLQDDHDIDFETSSGILTLTFENGSKVIINRQVATHEIWVAARSGGFHLGRQADDWLCNTTRETLTQLLSRVCSEQTGASIQILI